MNKEKTCMNSQSVRRSVKQVIIIYVTHTHTRRVQGFHLSCCPSWNSHLNITAACLSYPGTLFKSAIKILSCENSEVKHFLVAQLNFFCQHFKNVNLNIIWEGTGGHIKTAGIPCITCCELPLIPAKHRCFVSQCLDTVLGWGGAIIYFSCMKHEVKIKQIRRTEYLELSSEIDGEMYF